MLRICTLGLLLAEACLLKSNRRPRLYSAHAESSSLAGGQAVRGTPSAQTRHHHQELNHYTPRSFDMQ